MKKLLGTLGILSLLIFAFSFMEFHSSMTKGRLYNEANESSEVHYQNERFRV